VATAAGVAVAFGAAVAVALGVDVTVGVAVAFGEAVGVCADAVVNSVPNTSNVIPTNIIPTMAPSITVRLVYRERCIDRSDQ
jgi:hypothetical protein